MIAFDLDMTLIDSRPGVGAALSRVSEETGTFIDVELALSRFGPPIELELELWFPPDQLMAALDLFVAHLADGAAAQAVALPGAEAALEAAKARAPTLIVTRKPGDLALVALTACGLAADLVVGGVWGEAKARALAEQSATMYVGDDPADMRAAVSASALAIGVTSGPSSRDELLAAGAHQVLEDLIAFPGFLRAQR